MIISKWNKFFKWYQKALNRRPYLVQAIQSGVLMGAGDLTAQIAVEKKTIIPFNVDYIRALKFTSIGFFICGPALHKWYVKLDLHFGSNGKTAIIKKVFVDQALFAPSFLGILLVIIGLMQHKPCDIVAKELRHDFLDVLKSNYLIWPAVQLVNFYFLPLQYQALLVQVVSLFWNTFISWKTHVEK